MGLYRISSRANPIWLGAGNALGVVTIFGAGEMDEMPETLDGPRQGRYHIPGGHFEA